MELPALPAPSPPFFPLGMAGSASAALSIGSTKSDNSMLIIIIAVVVTVSACVIFGAIRHRRRRGSWCNKAKCGPGAPAAIAVGKPSVPTVTVNGVKPTFVHTIPGVSHGDAKEAAAPGLFEMKGSSHPSEHGATRAANTHGARGHNAVARARADRLANYLAGRDAKGLSDPFPAPAALPPYSAACSSEASRIDSAQKARARERLRRVVAGLSPRSPSDEPAAEQGRRRHRRRSGAGSGPAETDGTAVDRPADRAEVSQRTWLERHSAGRPSTRTPSPRRDAAESQPGGTPPETARLDSVRTFFHDMYHGRA